jgi:uncharacterized phage protein (TIGR02218 family)
MTAYETEDISEQDGNPTLLFTFTRGSSVWRYTNGIESLALPGGFTYTPEVITCGNIASTGDVPKDQLPITLPITNDLASGFLTGAPDQVTTVTVFRTSFTAKPDGLMVWKGRVLSVGASVATVTLTCEPVFTSLRRLGLRQTYQRTCRHMLFGPGCYVDPIALEEVYTVLAVVGAKVTLSATLSQSFLGGTLKAIDGTSRMVVDGGSNYVVLMRPIAALTQSMIDHPTGFNTILIPGCDKSVSTCRDKFHNLGNFGGFPGITGINPFSGTSNVF